MNVIYEVAFSKNNLKINNAIIFYSFFEIPAA